MPVEKGLTPRERAEQIVSKEKEELENSNLTQEQILEKQAEKAKEEEAKKAEEARIQSKSKELGKSIEEIQKSEELEKKESARIAELAKKESKTPEQIKEGEELEKHTIEIAKAEKISLEDAEKKAKDKIKENIAIKELAEKEKISIEEARLTKQYRDSQRGFEEFRKKTEADRQKLEQELKTLKAKLSETPIMSEEEAKAKIIEHFRKTYPAKSETMTDEAILDEVKQQYEVRKSQQTFANEKLAQEKLQKAISSLSPEEKELLPEIENMISQLSPEAIIDDNFSLGWMFQFARGDSEKIKSLSEAAEKRGYEKGYKAAQKERELLGENTPPSAGNATIPKKVTTEIELTKAQETQRLEMGIRKETYINLYNKCKEKAKEKGIKEPNIIIPIKN